MVREHRTRWERWAILALLALPLVACNAAPTATTIATTLPTSTTMAPVTTTVPTTVAPSTSTSTTEASTTTEPGEPTADDILGMASRSGCTPGNQTGLPDGEWFGYVPDVTPEVLDFDLACWFEGEAANLAAAEDGMEVPVPNDYYVRNTNETIRELPIEPGTEVTFYPSGDPTDEETGTVSDWIDAREALAVAYSPDVLLGVWITVDDGVVDSITEMWVP